MLAPVVNLTRKFDLAMLGYQRVELAEGWELGPWDVVEPTELFEGYPLTIDLEESKTESSGATEAQKGMSGIEHCFFFSSDLKERPGLIPSFCLI